MQINGPKILESRTFSIELLCEICLIVLLNTVILLNISINFFLCLCALVMRSVLPLFSRQFPESPASSPTKKNMVRPDYEHQICNLYTKSGQSLCNYYLKSSAFILGNSSKRVQHRYTTFCETDFSDIATIIVNTSSGRNKYTNDVCTSMQTLRECDMCASGNPIDHLTLQTCHLSGPKYNLSLGCEGMLVCFFLAGERHHVVRMS